MTKHFGTYDPTRSIARAAEQAVETYGQTGDAERAMQRLCAAVNEHRKGQGNGPAPGVYRKGQGST